MNSLVTFKREHRRKQSIDNNQFEIVVNTNQLIFECKGHGWKIKKEFDLCELGLIYKHEIALKVGNAVCEYLMRFSQKTAASRFQEFKKYIKHTKNMIDGDFILVQSEAELIKSKFLICSIDSFVKQIRGRSVSLCTQAEFLNSFYLVAEELFSVGLGVPVNRIKMPKNYHYSKKVKKSLLEKNDESIDKKEMFTLLEELKKKGYLICDETLPFILSLKNSVGDSKHDKAGDFFESLLLENNARLQALRNAAVATFVEWRNVYKSGQISLQNADMNLVNKFQIFLNQKNKDFNLFWSIFPMENYDLALSNFLKVCVVYFEYKVPACNYFPDFRSSLSRLIRFLGGKYYVDAMLSPHKLGVTGAVLLYLVDSGSNVCTAVEMDTDFESKLEDKNYVMVQSIKPRAGYKPIVTILPITEKGVEVTAVEALRFIRDATIERRKLVDDGKNKLFVCTIYERPAVVDGYFISRNTRKILEKFNLPLSWTLDSIRMSVAMKTMWFESGRISDVARKLGQAKDSSVTNGYAFSYPIRGLLEHYIRQFQDLFQFATALNVEGVVEKLGCPVDQVDALKDRVVNSGLGFLWSKKSIIKSDNPISKTQVNNVNNQSDRILILVEEENLAKIIATNQILNELMIELETQAPSQWEHKWAPLLALSQVAIEKVKRSEFAFKLIKAKELAQELIKSGFNPVIVGDY